MRFHRFVVTFFLFVSILTVWFLQIKMEISAASIAPGSNYWISHKLYSPLSQSITVELSKHSPDSPPISGSIKKFKLSKNRVRAPNIGWQNVDGITTQLKSYKGKVVFLNLWASWCAPCIKELPSINKLKSSISRKKLAIIPLSLDRGSKTIALRIKQRLGLETLKFYWDERNSIAKTLNITALPTTIIFDSKGREVGRIVSAAEWDRREAINLIKFFIDHPDYAETLPEEGKPINLQ